MTEPLYPASLVHKGRTDKPEAILTAEQWKAIADNNPTSK